MANEKRLIDAYALADNIYKSKSDNPHTDIKVARNHGFEHDHFLKMVCLAPTVDAVEVVHGRWVLIANEEYSNYRWNVTAECSECHHSKGEIYAGFFPGFPKDIARCVVLDCAKNVKLDNYCHNCGAKMDQED